ncbi:putative MYST-like histone acetyltransferase 1 [Dendrobium catenatum]|uniref:putative MYST-like histone acetyltransferase 1 n=1 Tax=Dendrobium catenatum TaxID=906689 RepID=UPI00109FEC35|nr:putative MYST-like histone acetyltransferase 1 [Dendrobium catenatum]
MGSIEIEGIKAESGAAATGTVCNGSAMVTTSPATEIDLPSAASLGIDEAASKKVKTVGLPLEVGTRVMCRWRDQNLHPVKVIERRKLSSGGTNDYEYYVHYTEFNRRLDEWVKS